MSLEHQQSARSTWKCVLKRNRSTWKCVLRRNRRFTMTARRASKSTARGTVNDAVKASSRPWSTRHGPQSCILRCDRRKILTRASCKGCDVVRSTRNHQGPSETQKNETVEEKSIRNRTENAPRNCTFKTRPERVRYQEGEGRSSREH